LRPALIIQRSAPFALRPWFPVEGSGFPDMDQTKKENEDEKADVGETGPAKAVRRDCPGSDKDDFYIENNKEDRNQVERDRALEACIVER
jgi:hypothetical protein